MQNGIALTARAAALADRPVRRPRRLGHGRRRARTTRSAWAWAGNAPFQWGKQVASHLGGTRNGMVVSWPERIKDAGGLRTQFTHCIDVGPDDPRSGRHPGARRSSTGSRRSRWRGRASSYTFDGRERAGAPHRAVLRDRRQPGDLQGRLVGRLHSSTGSRGTLSPPTMARFAPGRLRPGAGRLGALLPARRLLAGERPRRRAPREARRAEGSSFWEEAEKHNVLPLLAGFSVFFGILPPMPTITTQTFYGGVAEHRRPG